MSHQNSTPTKKSVFDRIGGGGSSIAPTTMLNASNKSTHGFCNSFIKSGSCPLGDACKYIHEQPNLDKPQLGSKDELRITKTTTRIVDITSASSSVKSTVTVTNDQRPLIVSNTMQSNRTVVESITTPIEHSDRRSSNTDRKQSQNRSDLKSKSTFPTIESAASSSKRNDSNNKESKKKKQSSRESRHSTSKKRRSGESDSAVSSASDSEYVRSSNKRKKHEHVHTSSKPKRRDSISPVRHRVNSEEEETLNDQLMRQTQLAAMNKSPKRTIVIAHNPTNIIERKKDTGNVKRSIKDEQSSTAKKSKQYSSPSRSTTKIDDEETDESKSKSKALPEIEILSSSSSSSKKTNESRATTTHPIPVSGKKSQANEVKRERKSPTKSAKSISSDQQQQQKNVEKRRRHSSSTNSSASSSEKKDGKASQTKSDISKQQPGKSRNPTERYERSDRSAPRTTPTVVQLSPPPISTSSEPKLSVPIEIEKIIPSPICVVLDDDSSPTPTVEKKVVRQTSTTTKKRSENKSSPKQTKRSRESDKTRSKETTSNETKRKRLNDGSSRKTESSSKGSTNNRSDSRRNANDSSRDDSSNRKRKQDKTESLSASTTSSKPQNSKNNDRRDTATSSTDNKRSARRDGSGKEKGLENVTDAEEHADANLSAPVLPKQTALEAYMTMDWSLLSRDKRIPLNSQTTSRIARFNGNTHRSNLIERLGVAKRLLTNEQKEQLTDLETSSSPLTHFMTQLQSKSASQIVHSCERRFGSCAKDMIDMRHKWFTRSIEPIQQYEFINKEHYMAFQQAINMLLNKTPNDGPVMQIESTMADALLSNTSTVPSTLPV